MNSSPTEGIEAIERLLEELKGGTATPTNQRFSDFFFKVVESAPHLRSLLKTAEELKDMQSFLKEENAGMAHRIIYLQKQLEGFQFLEKKLDEEIESLQQQNAALRDGLQVYADLKDGEHGTPYWAEHVLRTIQTDGKVSFADMALDPNYQPLPHAEKQLPKEPLADKVLGKEEA